MNTLEPIIKEHAFFKGLDPKHVETIVGCATNVVFKGKEIVFNEGDAADKFYLVRKGRIAIYLAHPQTITVQTLHEGDILGWSWLIPPHEYRFTAKATEDTQAIVFDGKCLRGKCEQDKELGYELIRRLVGVSTQRLEATMLQVIELSK